MLASAPEAVRAAFELDGDEFRTALRKALAEMDETEAAALLLRLREAGLIGGSSAPDLTELLRQFEPVLQTFAVATSDEGQRAEVETLLADLKTRAGTHCVRPTHLGWRA